MRSRALMLLAAVLALGGAVTDASVAEAPARASASATLVAGSAGTVGELDPSGDGRRAESVDADRPGIRVASGELVTETSRDGGRGRARATAVARSVSVFDGLVTAYGVRRTADGRDGTTTYAGRVRGLKINGRLIGDVATEEHHPIDAVGTVTVNRGRSALVVRLTQAANGHPAGSSVRVATVEAKATDGADPAATPAATPAPTATPTATPPKSRTRGRSAKLKRRKAPAVPRRLTARRFIFPVYGRARVADDFGAARQIGAHQGNDIFAPFGAPVLAVTDGKVFKVGTLPISGNRLWLRSKARDEFFYAHLSAFSPAAVNGRRVKAGEVLGFTGNTGDAEPTPAHVHFEIHPGGEDAIDPHAILSAWQRKRDVPPGAWLTRYGSDTRQRPGALVEIRDFIDGE